MRWVSIGLFTHKNRTNTLEASINITNKTPFEYIPDTEILNAGGLHTLRFTIFGRFRQHIEVLHPKPHR